MRILLLTSMVPQANGTGAIPILLYAELIALAERHDVTLVTAAGDEPGETAAAAALADAGFDVHVADRRRPPPGIDRWRRRWRLAATWARGRWPWRTVWFADPGVQTLIDRLAATRRFDVVVVEDSPMSVFRVPRGVPTVLTEHEVRRPRTINWRAGPPRQWLRSAFRELDWRRWERFQRESWRRFDRVQVFTDRDASAIAELAPEVADRVRVNPFGLVLPPAPDPAREVPGTVLFVGNFAHSPNRDAAVWLALEIMPAVRARCPLARLRVVGNAPPRAVLDLAGPGVEVVADATSVEPHMAAASVVVAPVRTGGGMRMKVLEALATGKAVVTTARGAEGFNSLEADPPLVIAEGSEEIAAATTALLEDAPRRLALGRRARAFAERHHSTAAWRARLEAVCDEAREGVADRVEGTF
jgi:glycosyltransferase involved in cell wall biosynthesis